MRRSDMLVRLTRLAMSPQLGLRRAFCLMVLGDGISVALGVAAPLALKAIVDQLPLHTTSIALVEAEVASLALATLAPNVLAGMKQMQITAMVERLNTTLALSAVDAAFQRTEDSERFDLASALARLPYALQIIIDGLASRLVPTSLQLVASLGVIAAVAPRLEAGLLTATLLVYALVVDAGYRTTRRKAANAHQRANALSHRLSDVLRHRRRVTANGALAQERSALETRANARGRAFRALSATGARGAMIQIVVLLTGSLAVLTISAARVLSGQVEVGTFVLLQSYVFRLALPIGALAAILRESDLAFENLGEVLTASATPSAGSENRPAPAAFDLNGGIVGHGVGFGFAGQPLLRDLTFALPPRAFVAIVGANGSGKSTLARLLAGLLEPQAGSIELFGEDVTGLSLEARRGRVLYVPQFVGLFDRTIRENGGYPPTRLTAAELSKRLSAWRFDPGGAAPDLDAGVGPSGQRLSGGQIQKLELARLTGVSTPALILDETTSALDPHAQTAAIRQLRAASPDQMLILVTHARHVAEQADCVVFLEAGALAGLDSHRRLMRTHSTYRAFWRSETFGGGSLDRPARGAEPSGLRSG